MERIKDFLRELGFRKNEIEVYVALVSMKESSVLQISKKTGLHRANIYDALDSLMRKGLIFTLEDPTKKYIAREPRSLLDFLKRMEKDFEDVLLDFEARNVSTKESKVKKSQGKLAAREALFGLLKKNLPIYSYGISESANELLGPSLTQFHKERIEKGIPMKSIYNTKTNMVNFVCDLDLTETRNLSSEYDSEVTTNICGEEVVLISWKDNTLIHIQDENIARSYYKYFELLWEKAKNACRPELKR